MASEKVNVLTEEQLKETFTLTVLVQEDPEEIDDMDEGILVIPKYEMIGTRKGD